MPTKPIEPIDMEVVLDEWERLMEFSLSEALVYIIQIGNNPDPTPTLQFMMWTQEIGYDPKSFMAGLSFGWGAREIKGLKKK